MATKIIMDAYDVHVVTKYSLGHCRRILRKIKLAKNKQKHHKVTVEELGEYLGISPDTIRSSFSLS